ncbi:hypothetical protein N0V84_005985 [Fusarium piperis]|uniref:Uncharacterized protein n=1 Tax=Fusarium piperis TaxID=1435070 RepID=A0A9W8WCQ0_9HYPO|nr:hypothetical protein N0V84_005985 [Fusarium piperis]
MLLQILRFTLPTSTTISNTTFSNLRKAVAMAGAQIQYFGYSVQTRVASLPKKRHEVSWIIQWPDNLDLSQRPALRELFNELSQNNATSLLVEVAHDDPTNLLTALKAPVCEVVAMRMKPDATLSVPPLETSMHKTYTDCYKMQGFVGGDWGYAVNTNSTRGAEVDLVQGRLEREQRRLAIYFLGWESIELHEDASTTTIFAEEMDKLGPWIESESGAWYVTLRKDE